MLTFDMLFKEMSTKNQHSAYAYAYAYAYGVGSIVSAAADSPPLSRCMIEVTELRSGKAALG